MRLLACCIVFALVDSSWNPPSQCSGRLNACSARCIRAHAVALYNYIHPPWCLLAATSCRRLGSVKYVYCIPEFGAQRWCGITPLRTYWTVICLFRCWWCWSPLAFGYWFELRGKVVAVHHHELKCQRVAWLPTTSKLSEQSNAWSSESGRFQGSRIRCQYEFAEDFSRSKKCFAYLVVDYPCQGAASRRTQPSQPVCISLASRIPFDGIWIQLQHRLRMLEGLKWCCCSTRPMCSVASFDWNETSSKGGAESNREWCGNFIL